MNFKGTERLPDDDLRLIRSKGQIVDASRKTLLVEVHEEQAAYELARKLPNWTVKKEVIYPVPSTRPLVMHAPKK